MAKFKDFDAMIAEMHHETEAFRIFGKEYHIKNDLPAIVVLEMSKYDDDVSIPTKVLIRAGRLIFGDDVLDELTAHPEFTTPVLFSMIRWAFSVCGGGEEKEMEEITEDDIGVTKRKN